MMAYLLKKGEESLQIYIQQYQAAVTIEGNLLGYYKESLPTNDHNIPYDSDPDYSNPFHSYPDFTNYYNNSDSDYSNHNNSNPSYGSFFQRNQKPGDPINSNLTYLTGWFHNEALHTPATTLNLVGNTLLDYFTGKTDYNIEVTNHPLPLTTIPQNEMTLKEALLGNAVSAFIVAFLVTFGMVFLVSTFVLFPIKERIIKAKHSQFVTGVHTVNFWVSTFAWDFINYLIPSLLMLFVFFLYGVDAFSEGTNAGYSNLTY